jgi:hypothetical protein
LFPEGCGKLITFYLKYGGLNIILDIMKNIISTNPSHVYEILFDNSKEIRFIYYKENVLAWIIWYYLDGIMLDVGTQVYGHNIFEIIRLLYHIVPIGEYVDKMSNDLLSYIFNPMNYIVEDTCGRGNYPKIKRFGIY